MRFIRVVLLTSVLALVVVPVALALRFTDESYHPPVGETGKAYSWSFTGAGGCGPALPYQYKILNGSAPPGLTLDTSGLVHGTPTQAGEWSFWVELSDENPPSADWCRPSSAQREFTFTIVPGLNINQNALSPKATFINAPYSFQLTATGPGTWSVISGALPAGITLNSSNGLLSGTPTATGDFTFKIKITDGSRTDAETYTLTVVEALKIATPALPAAEVGLPFTVDLEATGGRPAWTWSLANGALPAGLTLDPATGVISGSPGAAGSYPLKLMVTDTLGLTTTQDMTLKVAAKLALVRKALPTALVGKKYLARVSFLGGVTPRVWKIFSGKPPAGFILNRRTGILAGTPKKAGTFRFSIQVKDKLGALSTRTYLLKVLANGASAQP
jgi:large repetitive protein